MKNSFKIYLFSLLIFSNFMICSSQEKPNVLMIVLDDLNDYIGVLDGHPQASTPNIDKLANEGVLFANAHSNAPICAPSRASFMSGILPITSQNFGFDNWLNNSTLVNSKILPEYFSANGYTTYKTGKVTHSSAQEDTFWDHRLSNSLDYGPFAYNGSSNTMHPSTNIEYYENSGPLDATIARLSDIPNVPNGYNGWWSNGAPFLYTDDDNRDQMPDEKSVEWLQTQISNLENAQSATPFFMALGLIRPHSPLVVPDTYFDRFPLEEIQIPVIKRNDREDTHFDGGTAGYTLFEILGNESTDRQLGLRKKVQAYLACVAFADDMVGQIMTTLDNSSYANNTIVMLFSDHGYHVGEKQYLRKNALWNEATRVPLIIRSPEHSQNAGGVVAHPVSLVDVYPTLKDLCNLEGDTKKNSTGTDLDGHSLKAFLDNPNTSSWSGPSTALSSVGVWGKTDPSEQNYGVVSKRYRYTKYANGEEELYDHLYDENEWINIKDRVEYITVKQELKQQLDQQTSLSNLFLKDSLINFDKVYSYSNNWSFLENASANLVDDPEQIVRTNTSVGSLTYQVDNLDSFQVDLWGILDEMPTDFGSIRAFVAGADEVYSEITVDFIAQHTFGYRRAFKYSPQETIPEGTQYIRFELSSPSIAPAWKALLGTIWLYDDGSNSAPQTSVDELEVTIDTSIFEVPNTDLRTNEDGFPNFSDPLETINNFHRTSGNINIITTNPDDYGGDSKMIVRDNSNLQDVELVYDVASLNHFRIEFWTLKDTPLENINNNTGTIQTYISSNLDASNDYTEVPLKFVRIKIVGDWILYALVPENEIETAVNFFKVSITGGTAGNMLEGKYGAIHLYDSSLDANQIYYVDSTNGSDDNNGLSEGAAWQSIGKVNQSTFLPGDRILFKSGQEFFGKLIPPSSGDSSNLIIFGKYGGDERPTINGKNYKMCIDASEKEYIEFKDLILKNDASEDDATLEAGADERRFGFYASVGFSGIKRNITLNNIKAYKIYPTNASGTENTDSYKGYGFLFTSTGSGENYYDGITIKNCEITDIGYVGISINKWIPDTNPPTAQYQQNIDINNNNLHHIGGSGMVFFNVQNFLIENNIVTYTGDYSLNSKQHGRGSGFWSVRCKDGVLQHNEFSHARGAADSCGAHIDIENDNVIVQYNVSYDNAGGFAEFMGANTNCIYRYNVSINDGFRVKWSNGATLQSNPEMYTASGEKNTQEGKIIWFSDFTGFNGQTKVGSKNNQVYNNTIYIGQDTNGDDITSLIRFENDTDSNEVKNNIFYVESESTLNFTKSSTAGDNNVFSNNLYSNSGPSNSFFVGTSDLTNSDPLFVNRGGVTAADYKLTLGSPAIDAGVFINNNGGQDYWETSLSENLPTDIGASEFDNSITPTNTWNGAMNTSFTNAGNWSRNEIPNATEDIIIPSVANDPIIGPTTGAEVNNITIESDANLTVSSGGSLIVHGNSSGDVTYNRTVDYVGGLSGYPADSEIQTTDTSWLIAGTGFTFPAKNVASGGAASSNWFVRMERGGTENFAYIERVYPLTAGETYEFKASVFPDAAGQSNAYNLRVMDGATEVVASANPTTGSTWEELSISYTAAETKNYKFRVQKSWGNQGASIDNYSIVCTSCDPQETVYSDDFEAVYVNDNLKGWYLMASPVAHSNFSVDTFTTNNDIATSNSHVAIATYGTSSDNWSYFLAGATRNFLPGKGYSIKKASTTGTVSFTGTLHTEDAGVDIALSSEGNRYNLLGNPYTSYINSATFLANAALSETQTIWVYDQTLGNNGSYVAKPLVEDFILAPGQGFFVKANAAGGSVNFAETNQSHTSDTFQKTSKTEVTIQLSVNGAIQYAKLYYLNTATTGFDVGYEGEVFGGTTDEFSIYTHLLTDNVGKKYQVQSLPNSEYESMVIPVGVKAAANKEIIISAEALNLPEDVNVFLEDKQTNTFTRLDEANSNYKITLTENLDGIGRFYLHTTSNDLSTNDVKKDHISIYKTNNFTLRIVGLSKGIANIKLYNILGKEMMRAAFISQAVKEIYLPKLTAGIYIVQLKTAVGNINKKIILN